MPYVPSHKTEPSAEDRALLDPKIDAVADLAVGLITTNASVTGVYKRIFLDLSSDLTALLSGTQIQNYDNPVGDLAQTIVSLREHHDYDGAELGELNYSITRFIQRVPQIMVERGRWKSELRYWLYGRTVSALLLTVSALCTIGNELCGIFEDVKDEYKWRVNRAYEAAQIVKSGDCYDTPYYSRLMEVLDGEGRHIGYMDVYLKRREDTVNLDVLPLKLVLS
jgi:hypothetical protein